jgi:hypothetical protein
MLIVAYSKDEIKAAASIAVFASYATDFRRYTLKQDLRPPTVR